MQLQAPTSPNPPQTRPAVPVLHASYVKPDFPLSTEGHFSCGYETDVVREAEIERLVEEHEAGSSLRADGDELRTYRTAVATTGEYTTWHGGTVALGLAAVVTAINRVGRALPAASAPRFAPSTSTRRFPDRGRSRRRYRS